MTVSCAFFMQLKFNCFLKIGKIIDKEIQGDKFTLSFGTIPWYSLLQGRPREKLSRETDATIQISIFYFIESMKHLHPYFYSCRAYVEYCL